MSSAQFANVPIAQREIVHAALVATIGAPPVASIRPVPGGVSGAWVFRVDAGGYRYVVRIEGLASPLRNPHQYAAMRIAAAAGIAPRLHHVDETARVVVMDFIEDQPLQTFPGGARELARATGRLLRQLQALPSFPRFVAYPDIVARLWAHVCRTGLFADGMLDPHTERLQRIRDACAWNSDNAVASHNDVLPRNLLFDGNRLWLIDWESAYLNDPLVDVGTALDNFAPAPELEDVLLRAWLGHAPDQSLRERLTMIRALSRLYYAGVLLSASARAPRARPDADLSALTPAEFEQAVRSRSLHPETPDTSHALGKIFLASFLSGAAPPGLPPMFMR